jgi:hypothetical protein
VKGRPGPGLVVLMVSVGLAVMAEGWRAGMRPGESAHSSWIFRVNMAIHPERK